MANNANTVSIISGGTTYFFHDNTGTRTAYTGSNTPWTSAATSCYVLALNTTAGPIWVPGPAHANVMYSGGPPFANGRKPVYQSYDNITETIGVQLYATTKDNAIFLLRQLRQILNTATPPVLSVKSGTNTAYTEIYRADIDEASLYLVEPTGDWRATLTWTRYPHFGRLATGETLINGVSTANTGTGSPSNVTAFSAGAGDLIYEGQPLNMTLAVTAGSLTKAYLGSIDSRAYDTSLAGVKSTTTTVGMGGSFTSVANALTNDRLKCRVMLRFSAVSANARIYIKASTGTGIGIPFFTSKELDPDDNATILDMGFVPLDLFRQIDTSTNIFIDTFLRSSNGASASVTLSYIEIILYYDWAVVEGTQIASGSSLRQRGFTELSNRACLPKNPAGVFYYSGGGVPLSVYQRRGTLPRYFSTASLYLAWLNSSNVHTTTDTISVTATHGPQYASVRGNG